MLKLSDQQRKFCYEYIRCDDYVKAAIYAGYSNPHMSGKGLLKSKKVLLFLKEHDRNVSRKEKSSESLKVIENKAALAAAEMVTEKIMEKETVRMNTRQYILDNVSDVVKTLSGIALQCFENIKDDDLNLQNGLKAVSEIAKIQGLYAPVKSLNATARINIGSDSDIKQVREALKELSQQSKKEY